jgi:Asp-tRNA(Asn)/Glu-tRNA(Gln) amidotransferase A subunit family amidase
MLEQLSPLTHLRQSLTNGTASPTSIANQTIAQANSNASHNTYLWFHPDHLLQQAAALEQPTPDLPNPKLHAIPISLKDCFDLANTPTTCGTRFYANQSPATQDSALATALRATGALLTGKTHLHPLAYGITGQNPTYGDCLQPRDPTLLTGGSSSGAAASVQEGSALAAIGTDTGGSIRVPAALCGLVGYRASQQLPAKWFPNIWQGAAHLAPTFDTVGILLRDPRDAAPIAEALFHIPPAPAPATPSIGAIPLTLVEDADPDVLTAYAAWKHHLTSTGAEVFDLAPSDLTPTWNTATEIFAPIQAHEAAEIHAGHYHHLPPDIRDRLLWGASLTPPELATLRARLADFRASIQALFERYDFLTLPCAPISRLYAHADHTTTRQRILRYTCPFSLAGLPTLALPGELLAPTHFGTGIQLAAAPGQDPTLLAYAQTLGSSL